MYIRTDDLVREEFSEIGLYSSVILISAVLVIVIIYITINWGECFGRSCSSSSKYVIFNLPRKTSEQELKDHFKRNNVENVEVQIANNVAVITSMQTLTTDIWRRCQQFKNQELFIVREVQNAQSCTFWSCCCCCCLLTSNNSQPTKLEALFSGEIKKSQGWYKSQTGCRIVEKRDTCTIEGSFWQLALVCSWCSNLGRGTFDTTDYEEEEELPIEVPVSRKKSDKNSEHVPLIESIERSSPKKVYKTKNDVIQIKHDPVENNLKSPRPSNQKDATNQKDTPFVDELDVGMDLYHYMTEYCQADLKNIFKKHHAMHEFKSSPDKDKLKLKITSPNGNDASEEFSQFYRQLDSDVAHDLFQVPHDVDKKAFEAEAGKFIHEEKFLLTPGNSDKEYKLIGSKNKLPEMKKKLMNLANASRPVNPTPDTRPVGQAHASRLVDLTPATRPVNPTSDTQPVGQAHASRPVNPTPATRPVNPTSATRPVDQAHASQPATDQKEIIRASGIKILIYAENLTKVRSQAIVNPANPRLQHGGGAAKAIAKGAGHDLVRECDAYVNSKGKLKISQVMHSTAGKLYPIKYVIHVAGPSSSDFPDPRDQNNRLVEAFLNCMVYANDTLKIDSISIPAISSGIYGIPKEMAASAAFEALTKFEQRIKTSDKPLYLKQIDFVNIDRETTDVFITIFSDLLQDEKNGRVRYPSFDDEKKVVRTASNGRGKRSVSGEPEKKRERQLKQSGGLEFVAVNMDPSGSGPSTGLSKSWSIGNVSGNEMPGVINPQKSSSRGNLTQSRGSVSGSRGNVAGNMVPLNSGMTKLEDCVICMEPMASPQTLPCGHRFCPDCIKESFEKCQPKCPSCGRMFGLQRGIQPEGTMVVKTMDPNTHLSGYEKYPTLEITYHIPDGIQDHRHPNPGVRYHGTTRIAYLPASPEGQEICQQLQTAFNAKLIFTVGRSNTTGFDNQVIWNDIHHKTSFSGPFGYPDPNYLSRVRDELAAKGLVSVSSPNAASKQTTL